jgi:hypothetical protein
MWLAASRADLFQEPTIMPSLPLVALAAGGLFAYFYVRSQGRSIRRQRREVVRSDQSIGDDVRAGLARIVAKPADIEVVVHDGVVALRGSVARNRRDRVLRAALATPGVKSVLNRLEPEGEPDMAAGEPDILQEWPAPSASTRNP